MRDFEGREDCVVNGLVYVLVVVVVEADDDGASTGTYNFWPLRSYLCQLAGDARGENVHT
jgi:hypothetical protein